MSKDLTSNLRFCRNSIAIQISKIRSLNIVNFRCGMQCDTIQYFENYTIRKEVEWKKMIYQFSTKNSQIFVEIDKYPMYFQKYIHCTIKIELQNPLMLHSIE